LAFGLAPRPDEVGDARVATAVVGALDLGVQRLGRAALAPGPPRVGLQRLLERFVEYGELVRLLAAPVLSTSFHKYAHMKSRLSGHGRVANPRDTTRYRCGLRLALTRNASISLRVRTCELGYLGGPSTWPCSHFATVLRDSPVMRAISRSDFFFRLCKRRILPIMSMVITPLPLLHKNAAG
jgi:hypothetical protein